MLVPSQSQQWGIGLWTFVDDGGVLLVSEVEDPYRSVGRDGGKYSSFSPGDVVYLLIVRNQLSLHAALLNVPDRARRVDAAGTDSLRLDLVPIEGSQRGTELACLAVVEHGNRLDGVVTDLPKTEKVAGGGKEVRFGMEHQLRRRIRMVEGERGLGLEGQGVRIEGQEVDTVVVVLDETTDGDSVVVMVVADRGDCHTVERIRGFIGGGAVG